MNVMISINPPYADMTMRGYKPMEFRKAVLKGMEESYAPEIITAYIYETKNKGGCGAVIGEVKIPGAYSVYYAKKDVEPDTELVRERYEFVMFLYLQWCKMKGIKPNMNEGWFKSKRFQDYEKEIGLFGKDDTLNFNYALILDEPQRYTHPQPISLFRNLEGKALTRPPENMQRVMPL